MLTIRTAIKDLLEAEQPMTNRQVFYRLVSMGVVGKTEAEYSQTVTRLLTDMRLNGEIPFEWIVDATRWDHKTTRWDDIGELMMYANYRRAIWRNEDLRIEVWLEKEALAGVVHKVTDPLDVSLMVTRGYSSLSFLWEAAKNIRERGAETAILILGDYDPSGQDIIRNTGERLEEWSEGLISEVTTLAVTLEQITQWNLPTRPTKRSDPRSKNFSGQSVELDAIPPVKFRDLIREALLDRLDEDEIERSDRIERKERRRLGMGPRRSIRLLRRWVRLNPDPEAP
jgi:hypothetical protein